MKVMIVDEDQELSDLLKKTLWMSYYAKAKAWAREDAGTPVEGLEIEQFWNQADALRHLAAASEAVKVIFTTCPACNDGGGADFIRACRNQYRDKYQSLILIAERGDQQYIDQGFQAGAEGCLLKPFSPEDLVQHL